MQKVVVIYRDRHGLQERVEHPDMSTALAWLASLPDVPGNKGPFLPKVVLIDGLEVGFAEACRRSVYRCCHD